MTNRWWPPEGVNLDDTEIVAAVAFQDQCFAGKLVRS
jgi:hypothetical protein